MKDLFLYKRKKRIIENFDYTTYKSCILVGKTFRIEMLKKGQLFFYLHQTHITVNVKGQGYNIRMA